MKQKTILIADDDIDYLTQMRFYVEHMGHKVITSNSQSEAEKILETTKPDLAIYDLMMEKHDSGFILSYKTKKLYPEVPIIIATNLTSDTGMIFNLKSDSEKKWIKADRYLEKGIRQDQLQKEVTALLKLKEDKH